MTKAKNNIPQEQRLAAPVVPNPPQEPQAPGAGDQNPNEQPPQEQPEDLRVLDVRRALRAFPTLTEGYICAKGVYFDKAIAEKHLAEGEELIIVSLEEKEAE